MLNKSFKTDEISCFRGQIDSLMLLGVILGVDCVDDWCCPQQINVQNIFFLKVAMIMIWPVIRFLSLTEFMYFKSGSVKCVFIIMY